VRTEPQLTCHSNEEKEKFRKVIRTAKDILKDIFDTYIMYEGFIYAYQKIDPIEDFATVTEDEVEYKISIGEPRPLTLDDPKAIRFFNSIFIRIYRKMRLRAIRGGKYFAPDKYKELKGVNMYSAYFTSIKFIKSDVFMTLNP
jgi:hypothetical protein